MTGVRRWIVGVVMVTAGLAAMDARAEECTGSFYACPPPNRPDVVCLTSCDAGCPNTTGNDPIWYQMNCDTGEIGGGGGCSCAGAAEPIPKQTCAGTCTYRQCDPSASQPPCTVGQGACKNTGPKTCTLTAATQKTVLSCDVKPLPASVERCDGIDNDCDGAVDDGFDTGADCTVGTGSCERSGKKVCTTDGLGTECNATAGASSVEVCDGIDNDCDGEADDGLECGPRDGGGSGGGSGGGPGPSPGPRPEDPTGADHHGCPVSAASGSMFFGPIPLAVIATPTGMPLAASLTYSSMKPDGKFGKGWTMSWEGSARLDGTRVVVRTGTGATLVFRRPRDKATSELGGGFQQLPNSRFITTALDASNVGFYIAEVPGPDLVARVSYADGSRLLFGPFDPTDKAELSGFEDRYGNQQLLDVIGISGLSLPRRLHQGVRRLSFDFSVGSDPTGNSQLTGARLSATVGSTVTPRARLVIDGAGMLTDICAIDGAAPARQCLGVGETTTPCNQPGERTLWRFSYAIAQGDPPGSLARMTRVMDETCAIVETHDYEALPQGQVVATSSASASEELLFSYATGAGGEIQQLTKKIALRPSGAPAGSQEPATVVSQIHIDTAAGRVKQVDASCGCGPEMTRTWIRDGAGAPRVSVVKEGSLFKSRVEFSRSPGTPTDPHRFGLPTGERRFDETSYASPQKTFLYDYQHPTIRSPTRVIGPGENGASALTVYDFDDDDEPCVVGFGVTQQRGDPTLANEHPTRFLCRIIETGFSPTPGRTERVTRFKYDTVGRLLKREGPGGDVTTWEYYADDDSDVLRAGMLKSISRLGGAQPLTTLFDDYHYTGQARRVERPNSEVTLSEFDARGRVTRLQEPDGATLTSWEADGKPAVTTLPRDNAIFNFWGAGAFEFGRLKRIEWRQSNSPTSALVQTRTFLYDRGGNVLLQEDFPGGATTPTRRVQRDYDESHRMVGEVATAGTRWHVYADNVEVETTDEAGLLTTFDFDGFGRLREVQAPENRTRYHYSPRDNLTEVEDGNGNKLSYTWDGFDDMLTASSPDFGTVRYFYTNDGLVEFKQDAEALARSEALETLYDGLRRPTVLKRHYVVPGRPRANAEEELVRNTWDVGTNALGRLGTVKDEGGTTTFLYDAAGRLEEESHLRTGLQTPLKLGYAYYPGGALKRLAYPPQVAGGSPQLLNIGLSADEEVAGLDLGGQPLATTVTHFPFGAGLRGFTRGNNLGTQYTQDADGRRTQVLGSPLSQTYLLDPRGLVETVTESGDSSRSRTYGYDGAMRLKHATYQTGQPFSEAYTYDAAGNRLTKVRNGTKGFISALDLKPGTQTPANNLLREVDPTVVAQDPTWRYQYTASGDVKQMQVVMPERLFDPSRPPGQGNPVFVPALEWTYCNTLDGRRRLTQVQYVARSGAAIGGAVLPCDDAAKLTTLAEYRDDAQLRRVYSKQTGVEKHFLFGPAGELLAEVSPQGNVERAYVWLDGEPYAMVHRNAGSIFYFHNDRMGTPQRLTDEAGKTVWRAEFRPFGDFETVDTDPDNNGVAVENNLRFAGQYDEGLFGMFAQGPYYNWNRSYEPATGRYLQSEPMLEQPSLIAAHAGRGQSTPPYSYALNNPLFYSDPDGRQVCPSQTMSCYPGCATVADVYVCGQALVLAAGSFAAALGYLAAEEGISLENFCNKYGVLCAKGGKQNIDNEYVRAARLQPDPCAWLAAQYAGSSSGAERLKIQAAQKALGCRNKQKRESNCFL